MTFDQWWRAQPMHFRVAGAKEDARMVWDAARADCKDAVLHAARGYAWQPGREHGKEMEAAHGVLIGVAAAL